MLPLHRTRDGAFNYSEIPAGYYYGMMLNGHPVQRFWHREKFRTIARMLRAIDAKNVLDLGCGPGSFLAVLAEEMPDIIAVGVDIASPQINFALSQVLPRFSQDKIQFHLLETERLPFPDASFDAVTCIEVVEHVHPFLAAQLLAEARRVLRPGGNFFLTTPNYRSFWPLIEFVLERLSPVKYHDQHISKFTPNSLVKFLETCGFSVEKVSSIFVAAPFLSVLSNTLANFVHKREQSAKTLLGSLLITQAKRMEDV